MSKMTVDSNSRLCNGQSNSNNYSNMNGTLAADQSTEEAMEVDQNGKWLPGKSSPIPQIKEALQPFTTRLRIPQ